MENDYKLHIGSYGWQYESWKNSFYPDDLPTEWQFAYYANEYSVIMIPWKLLQNDFELLEQGIEDSDDNCRLIFELAININQNSSEELRNELLSFLDKISFAGVRAIGIVFVLQYTELVNISGEKSDLIKELLQTCINKMKTCIDIQGINESEISIESLPNDFKLMLQQAGTDLCHYNDTNSTLLESSNPGLHVTFCNISKIDPRKMRAIVENSLIGECEGSTNVLIFRSENPNHEQMNTASVICDLL